MLADNILKDLGMKAKDRTEILLAIGNHEGNNPVSDISAALMIADKSDVHKSRPINSNSIHDKLNYAVSDAEFIIEEDSKKIRLDLTVDTKICPVLDYFKIFMDRAMMCKNAAKYLNIWFELVINDTKLL